jgi:hypothetical protein
MQDWGLFANIAFQGSNLSLQRDPSLQKYPGAKLSSCEVPPQKKTAHNNSKGMSDHYFPLGFLLPRASATERISKSVNVLTKSGTVTGTTVSDFSEHEDSDNGSDSEHNFHCISFVVCFYWPRVNLITSAILRGQLRLLELIESWNVVTIELVTRVIEDVVEVVWSVVIVTVVHFYFLIYCMASREPNHVHISVWSVPRVNLITNARRAVLWGWFSMMFSTASDSSVPDRFRKVKDVRAQRTPNLPQLLRIMPIQANLNQLPRGKLRN